jgi:hypothetical protein
MRIATFRAVSVFVFVISLARVASAQTPAPAATPSPDDTPSIRLGTVIFPDYTYTVSPSTTDTDGSTFHPNQFNVTRAFINVTGNISHLIAFRVTPDIARETSAFSQLSGSLEFRLQYAYAQFNLDDWMTPGTFARFGIQQTPWIDFAESIYRYRFQGTMFPERNGYLFLSDAGASFHYQFPSDFGDVHVGVFNGEGSNKAETNAQKAVMVRGTLRPFAAASADSVLHGLRASFFYDADHYFADAPRNRLLAALTFEHRYVNAGFEFLDASDQLSVARPEVDGRGYSVWVTPQSQKGLGGLLRYDHLEPNTALGSQTRNRTIAGVSYWFPHQNGVATALLLDYDGETFRNFLPSQPKQSKVAIHGLISF